MLSHSEERRSQRPREEGEKSLLKNEARGVELCNEQNRVPFKVYGYVHENKWHATGRWPDVKDNSGR